MKNTTKRWLWLLPTLYWAPNALADYQTDIGYRDLQTQLGFNTPTGANVKVAQVEASTVVKTALDFPIFAPDTQLAQFAGKTFSFPGSVQSTSPSSHATGVATLFYGNNSIATGIDRVTVYEANTWLRSLVTPTASAPVNGSRVFNHSWVGKSDTPAETGNLLRLIDRQVQLNETVQVVGMDNNARESPLIGNAFNVIAVGRSDGRHDRGSDAIDAVYVAGRTRPDLVAPQSTTSSATAIVSAAAALLVEAGHQGASQLSNGSTFVGGVGTVYNAERAETLKAALMAGAERVTDNSLLSANLGDYRSAGHQTGNGLDDRLGAGQINILHSYQIIAAGEQDSLEDSAGQQGGAMGLYGFDYDAAFGGANGSNRSARYRFTAETDLNLSATLVWNLNVADNASLTASLHDLSLELLDTTTQTTVAFSNSAVDNTENIWLDLTVGHSYQLLVKSAEAGDFTGDYALAWHTTPLTAPVPVPAAAYLFGSSLLGLGWLGRRKV